MMSFGLSRFARYTLPPLILAGAALLSSCGSGKPFLASDYRFHQRGIVLICYSDSHSTPDDVKAKADEICRQYDRVAKLQLVQDEQCSWTEPTRATFSCDPRPGETPSPILQHLAPMRHDTPLPP
jgi:hypothetical protein